MNIIIIGATSGIGRALFEKYAVDGNCIGIVGRRASESRGQVFDSVCNK